MVPPTSLNNKGGLESSGGPLVEMLDKMPLRSDYLSRHASLNSIISETVKRILLVV